MGGRASFARLNNLIFPVILLAFLCLGLLGLDHSCLDAADSAYVISSDAIGRGLMPYRDFLAAHPPMLYLAGAPLAKLGLGVLPFRVFSLLVNAALGFLVWKLALYMTRDKKIAILAGTFTLFTPLGLYFSKAFLNDSLASLLMAATALLLMGKPRWRRGVAGLLCVLGMLTKLTFLPFFVLALAFVLIYRRESLKLFLAVGAGGTIAAYVALQLVTGGAFLDNILGSQASKGYSMANLVDGLHRIWQIDWPLLVPAVIGIWFALRYFHNKGSESHKIPEKEFLLFGWLGATLVILATLPAEGHDTNLFLLAEPAVALLAAWGIIGLAGRRSADGVTSDDGKLSLPGILLVTAWLVLAVPVTVERDSDFFFRSNAGDVATVVAEAQNRSTDCQPVLLPGCYALEADRPVTLNFFDQFLWEEKYRRGDDDAVAMMDDLRQELTEVKPPLAVFAENQPALDIVGPELNAHYKADWQSEVWPPVTMWVPQVGKKPG
ncbi:MAG: glycosyltransferase family 39 protein [Thermoleophilia bacterium]